MKRLLILYLTFVIAVVSTHKLSAKSYATAIRATTNTYQTAEAQLRLSTSIIEQQYSVERGSKFLRLLLNLTYSNTGNQPILLDKKSSLIYRKLVSRSLKAASKKRYEYDATSHFITLRSLQAVGMRLDSPPERETFVTIKPGESYSLKPTEVVLALYDGTKDTEDDLRSGTHFLHALIKAGYSQVVITMICFFGSSAHP